MIWEQLVTSETAQRAYKNNAMFKRVVDVLRAEGDQATIEHVGFLLARICEAREKWNAVSRFSSIEASPQSPNVIGYAAEDLPAGGLLECDFSTGRIREHRKS